MKPRRGTMKPLANSLPKFSDDFMAERNQPRLQVRSEVGGGLNPAPTKDLPEGWVTVRLGDALTLINGRAFKPSEWKETGCPIVRIQNLNNPDAPFNYYDGELPDKFLLSTGDLLFAWSGTPGTSFGAHIWHGKKAWLNQHIFKVIFNESEFDKRFLQLAISQNLNEYIRQAHGGAGLAHITKGRFENSGLLKPSLNVQELIVAEIEKQFSRLDEAVAGLKRIKANLKRYKASVLKAAVEGKLTEEWRKAHPNVETGAELLKRSLASGRNNGKKRIRARNIKNLLRLILQICRSCLRGGCGQLPHSCQRGSSIPWRSDRLVAVSR